jgi:hypothetical protein
MAGNSSRHPPLTGQNDAFTECGCAAPGSVRIVKGMMVDPPNSARSGAPGVTPHLVFGLLIIFIGVVFTLDNLDLVDSNQIFQYWPTGLILLGATKFWQGRREHGGGLTGGLLMLVGIWLQLEVFDYVDQSIFNLWPLLLVIAGGALVWQGIRGKRPRPEPTSDTSIHAVAVLAGVERGSNSTTFRGGELTAFMGGCEIDLRQAAIHGEAVIDVFAMWGGIEIRVPDEWRVIGRVTPIMGGFEDKTRPPRGAAAHTLVIRGFVLMGGVEVKN